MVRPLEDIHQLGGTRIFMATTATIIATTPTILSTPPWLATGTIIALVGRGEVTTRSQLVECQLARLILLRLALHRWRFRVFDLEPMRRRIGLLVIRSIWLPAAQHQPLQRPRIRLQPLGSCALRLVKSGPGRVGASRITGPQSKRRAALLAAPS